MKRRVLSLILLALAGAAIWFGWNRHPPPPVPVDLTQHDGQTIDFSSGKAVVKDSPADRAALEKVAKELAEASNGVTFEAPQKEPAPAKPQAKKD